MKNHQPSTLAQPAAMPTATKKGRQRGFTLIELGIVLTIVAILALFAVPKVRGFIISGKVKPSAEELTAAVSRVRSAAGTGNPSYGSMTTAVLSKAMQNRTNSYTADGTTITHKIGASAGSVAVAVDTIDTASDAFKVTFSSVNSAACPDLAIAMSGAEKILIGTTTVKASASATIDGATAQGACVDGDSNTFYFTFR